MKRLFFAAFCILLLSGIAYSSSIEVGINEVVKGSPIFINYDNTSNLVNFSTEFFNTGSTGYKARAMIEIFENETLIFNGWSQEKNLTPGDRQRYDIYWFVNQSGLYQARMRMYYGNEIANYKKFDVYIDKNVSTEDAFEIDGIRTYDSYIIFDLKSKKDAKNIVIIPSGYVSGWIFEENEIPSLAGNSSRLVMMKYHPTLWVSSSIKLSVISDNGRFYTQKTFDMQKQNGFQGWLLSVFDTIRLVFS